MRSIFGIVTSCLLLACVDGPTIPRGAPTIRGTVRGPGELGSLLIQAGADSTSCDTSARAYVQMGHATIVRRAGGRAPATALQVGTVVSVWTTGAVLDMCPGIVTAAVVVIE